MPNFFAKLIPLGIFIFSIGMVVRGFSKANNSLSTDVFGLVNGLIVVGVVCFVIGLVGWIIQKVNN